MSLFIRCFPGLPVFLCCHSPFFASSEVCWLTNICTLPSYLSFTLLASIEKNSQKTFSTWYFIMIYCARCMFIKMKSLFVIIVIWIVYVLVIIQYRSQVLLRLGCRRSLRSRCLFWALCLSCFWLPRPSSQTWWRSCGLSSTSLCNSLGHALSLLTKGSPKVFLLLEEAKLMLLLLLKHSSSRRNAVAAGRSSQYSPCSSWRASQSLL